jgi:hypothetical protein
VFGRELARAKLAYHGITRIARGIDTLRTA